MQSRSPFGVNPAELDTELAVQRARHRTQVDLLKSRLSEVAARTSQLRQQREAQLQLLTELEAETQSLLEELDQTNAEIEDRRQALHNRHQRELEDRSATLEALRHELEGWVALERQIAAGVMAAVEPFLQLNSLLKEQEGGKGVDR